MPAIRFGTITINVKGYFNNNGSHYFQIAVPKRLQMRVRKANIKIPLKPEDGHFAIQCERLGRQYKALFRALDNDSSLVPSETRAAAIAFLRTHGLEPGDGLKEVTLVDVPEVPPPFDPQAHLHEFFDSLSGDNPVEQVALQALKQELPVLLSEAFAVYLDNHEKGKDASFCKAQKQHWDKLIAFAGDIALEKLTRAQAKQFRDSRLAAGVRTTTLKREINVIKAVINVARREVPLNIPNPFEALTIQGAGSDSDKRQPYSRAEIQKLIDAALTIDDEKRRIVILLALTGARLAEVVGLRKQDIDIDEGTITFQPHDSRSLKTASSSRTVPLIPLAHDVVKRQIASSSSDYLFPAYANAKETKANSASATLNKWANQIVAAKTMHSFRHAMRDQLRAAVCPEAIAKEIGGWSTTKDISVGYGYGYPLEVKRSWMVKAYSWLLTGLNCET